MTTQVECIRGPLDGLTVELKVNPGEQVELPCDGRMARYPKWGGLAFSYWDLVKPRNATAIAVYRTETPQRLVYVGMRPAKG